MKENFRLNKNKQCQETMSWIGALADACEEVIMTTDVSLIEPFELVNLINVRMYIERQGKSKSKSNTDKSAQPNLVLFKTTTKKDDTH